MTKDRISDMIRLMKENKMPGEVRESVPEETSESINLFLGQVQCCREEIRTMNEEIEVLKSYHNRIQTCINGTIRKDLEDKVEDRKTVITSSIIAIRNNLKSIQDIFSKPKISPALRRMKEVQINSLTRALNEVTENYYNCLVDHSEKSKKLLHDMISIADEEKGDFEELIQKGKVAFFTNNILLNELEQKVNFRNVEDRHADILRVEKSLLELKNLTQDLSLVVAVQAEKIGYVEQYVQKTAKKVDDTARIVDKASKLRIKARKRKLLLWILGLAIMIIVLSIIILV